MCKLGTRQKPTTIRVASEEKANEIYNLCETNGWKVIIGIEPGKPEDISDIQRLLGVKVENTKTVVNKVIVGRNNPCIYGSGKKLKVLSKLS